MSAVVEELKNEGTYEVKILSGILYAILPDGLPEFALMVQVEVIGMLFSYPLVLDTNVKQVPAIGTVVRAKYYENFYRSRYNDMPGGLNNVEERFVLARD